MSQRLILAANEKAIGSRRGSEKKGYRVVDHDDLEMDAKNTPAQQNTAYGNMGGMGPGKRGPHE